MTTKILSTAERNRRYQRDLRAYRQRSLFRRSWARFHRDLGVLPHLFLRPDATLAARFRQPREKIIAALRGRVVWTLDTAARLVCGAGFLATRDLTGYLDQRTLDQAVGQGLIKEPEPAALSLDPVVKRPSMLVVYRTDDLPPFHVLDTGDRVVTWNFLMRDIQGTLGWRPDLLTRIEGCYASAFNGR